MKCVQGIWLPEDDSHFQKMFNRFPEVEGKATYQYDKFLTCLKYCKEKRVAVDIGAHVGLWSRVMALEFTRVVAFEPVYGRFFQENLQGKRNIVLHEVALSDISGSVEMNVVSGNSGNTHIACSTTNPEITVPMATLDSYELQDVDFIKIDVEGWEYPVLAGAESTLKRCKPVVIFEQKGHDVRLHGKKNDCVSYMQDLGASIAAIAGEDIIMRWEDGNSSS